MQEFHTEVLIIGAGPTGLFCAGELARHGVKARIIDQTLTPHTQTRATEIQPAVLEVLHRAGLAGEFMESSLPMRGLRVLDVNMDEAFVFSIPPADSRFPDTRSMPQWRTEEILLKNLSRRGVEVERGVTAQTIALSENGARVECVDRDGRTFVIHADYLVGAGGAHSPTRGAINERLQGITYPKRYLVADVAAPGFHGGNHLISVAIGARGLVMMIELPGARSLLLTDISDTQKVDSEQLGLDDAKKAIDGHLKNSFEISDVRWASIYRMHRRQSPKFAEGRCFLAGDAAHICSPLGGEGLNAGLLDGASIAWKLAAVLRRRGKPALLAAYEPERQEIARQVLASSDAMHDYYNVLIDQVARGCALSSPPDDPTRKVTSGSMIDLSLSESPLLGFHGFYRTNAPIKPGTRFPERIRLEGCLHHLLVYRNLTDSDSAFASRWSKVVELVEGKAICPPGRSGVPNGGAVLVRPDGYIAFQAQDWNDDARNALDELLFTQFHPL